MNTIIDMYEESILKLEIQSLVYIILNIWYDTSVHGYPQSAEPFKKMLTHFSAAVTREYEVSEINDLVHS